jgi:hypothetical protein
VVTPTPDPRHDTQSQREDQVRASNPSPGDAALIFPWAATPADPDPFIGARSPDGKWLVVARVHLSAAGDFFLRDLHVSPWSGEPTPLGTEALRQLPIGRWVAVAHGELVKRARHTGSAPLLASSRVAGFGDDFYRRIARAYLELQEQGRGIQQRLSDESTTRLGRFLTPVQIRDAVSRATELGLLSPGSRGRVGRVAGPNLDLYDGNDKEA